MSAVVEVARSPWCNCHGYRMATVRYSDGSTRSVLEHREVMEAHLGRALRSNEHVHHKDGNRSNNELSNLEVLSPSEHAKRHACGPEYVDLTCIRCDREFTRLARYERGNRKQGKRGPYCGKRCSRLAQAEASRAVGAA